MQNWDTMQTTANYVEHNNWYNNMFATNIKTEPGTLSPSTQNQQHSPAPSTASTSTSHLENYLKQHQQQQQQQYSAMDTSMTTLTPATSISCNNANSEQQQQQFFDTTGMHHQQMLHQQHYQQHFQQAQQAAAQNQVTTHLPLGFNPLTPPGLPQAVLPAMSHFYTQSNNQQQHNQEQTPSPQLLDNTDKSALTPRHTPPMDITPPKSPKAPTITPAEQQQDQELTSNSSEDLKYIVDSEDETIRMPIYNSHGKMKNYKCKSCGTVSITKLAFWEHARTHMKPEKILQCHKCPFVTELKHHLEYHIRKHKNLKPFQCDKCSYSCVNKSMLNSHRKSHSSIYQYRCSECDYATKYCHSFKLHLRKYEHKPGLVLDEEGVPNPSVVIDVYGTRRGPKNKGSSASSKKSNNDLKMAAQHHQSQLSAALQGFPMNNQQNQMPASSATTESPALTLNMNLQQQQQQHTSEAQISPDQQPPQNSGQNDNITSLLPPLASLLQQNRNMAFFPYWNLNLQMLAAQQQAAVLAQLSPRMREQLQKQQQEANQEQPRAVQENEDLENGDEDGEEGEGGQENDRKSVDSAMDLSQGTPTKEDGQQQQTPELAMNLKLPEENNETPLFPATGANRRKGRVLKLDQEQQKNSATTSLQVAEESTDTSPANTIPATNKADDHSSADESMDTTAAGPINTNNPINTASTASSSGNSSNSSSTGTNTSSNNSTANSSPSATPTMFECKYCDIFFKDAVLYTIHMGYHSCDDVFKCNMCGEKCDGPVGLFVHMARNAHS